MRKKLLIFFSVIMAIVINLFQISCEYDPEGDNFNIIEPLPSEIKVLINLTDIESGGVFYIYGSTSFQINPEIGRVYSVEYSYNGKTIIQDNPFDGFYVNPEWFGTKESKDLKMSVTIIENNLAGTFGVNENSSSVTVDYILKYIRLTSSNFEVKSQQFDRILLKMINRDNGPCKYVVAGEEITDLDNIIFKRDYHPGYYTMRIYLLPENVPTQNYSMYDYCEIEFGDKMLGDFPVGSTINHYFDQAHQEVYAWSMSELFIHDKDLNILSHQMLEDIHDLMVTPKTGLVVHRRFNTITVYSDKSFSKITSTISNEWQMNIKVNERDQLFQAHNSQIDVFDLHTGNKIYTINLSGSIRDFTLSEDGKYVFVLTDYGAKGYIYSLDTGSASLMYSLEHNYEYWHCQFHPINKHHVIVNTPFDGFEIIDIETQQILFKNKGGFQSIDPITGNLLFWDENYSYQTRNYDNHFIDNSYMLIHTMIDNTQSTYGAYKQFNNFLIKDRFYIDISQQLINQ